MIRSKKYYVDLNVLFPLFEFGPFAIMDGDESRKSRETLALFITKNTDKVKLYITKTVFIEWVQKIVSVQLKKYGGTFNQFKKTPEFKTIWIYLNQIIKMINKSKRFFFEWKIESIETPVKDTWDHYHVVMREKPRKFLTFDKKFSSNSEDFVWIKTKK